MYYIVTKIAALDIEKPSNIRTGEVFSGPSDNPICVGNQISIWGDFGIVTTEVKETVRLGNFMLARTKNTLYLVEEVIDNQNCNLKVATLMVTQKQLDNLVRESEDRGYQRAKNVVQYLYAHWAKHHKDSGAYNTLDMVLRELEKKEGKS